MGGDGGALLLVNLGESGDPGWGLIGAATVGLVQANGLERSGKGEEDQRRSDKDSEVKVGASDPLKKGMTSTHSSFL